MKGKKVFYAFLVLCLFSSLFFSVYDSSQAPESLFTASEVLPGGPAPAPEPEILTFEATFAKNSTLQGTLLQFGFTAEELYQLIRDIKPVYDFNRVVAGQRFYIERLVNGAFRSLRYDINDEEYVVVEQEEDRYVGARRKHDFDVVVEEIYGRIDRSLYETLISRGETDPLVYQMLDILQWDVDFTSIQPNDSFKLIVEKKYLGTQFVKYGDVLAVQFTSESKDYFGFLFNDPETSKPRYYDEHGKSVRKAFLKVPFSFDPRITSTFSRSRYHPILKIRRPHLGVDYGAPAGTPVLASADGTVTFAGRNGGYGKFVEIRHGGGFATSYAHLSRIHVRNGQKVTQGRRIGAVGATGLATGPHLDYRVRQNGKYINPRNFLKLPSEDSIDKRSWQEFIAVRDAFRQRLAAIREEEHYVNRVSTAG